MESVTIGKGRGRKPIHLVAAVANGSLAGRDAIWAVIRQQKEFTRESIWLHLEKQQGDNRGSIASYLTCLKAGGYIEVIGKRWSGEDTTGTYELIYKLVKDCGIEAPRLRKDGTKVTQGIKRENMWRAIRILGEFDFRDLAVAASTEETPVKDSDARDYTSHLRKAGYFAIIKEAVRGKYARPARYKLIPSRNTGPKPPQIQKRRQVFDPNLNKVVWPVE